MDDVSEVESNRIFSRSFFPFFFSAFLVGLGMAAVSDLDEVVGYVCLGIGIVLAFYSVRYWMGYDVEINVTKRTR